MVNPSVLTANLARLGDECARLEAAGADRIHWDVMDGRFVPNLTFGPDVIAACRKTVDVPFDAHLMVVEPDELLPRYAEAGCSLITVHVEACRHLHRTLTRIREMGARAGVALNPQTPESAFADIIEAVDHVLVMTVNPGFGGQAYLASMEPKIARIRQLIDESGRDIELGVDGGIGDSTIGAAASAGADTFISGSWLLKHPDGLTVAFSDLREQAQCATR